MRRTACPNFWSRQALTRFQATPSLGRTPPTEMGGLRPALPGRVTLKSDIRFKDGSVRKRNGRLSIVAFVKRKHVTKLADVVAHPGEAAKLAQAVRALSEAMERYKSLLPFRTALLAYLDRVDTEVSRRWTATR
jgi:hypothetical protein